MIYLDNAATSYQKPHEVMASLIRHSMSDSVNSGRGSHKLSLRGSMLISDAQDSLAALFNIDDPSRIALTQNATYALNLAINGVLQNGGHAIVTSMEHNSVLRPVHRLGNYTVVRADRNGIVDPDSIRKAIKPDTKLIVCTHASNVCGSIQPIDLIGAIAREKDILFLVDAAQSVGVVDIDVKAQNIDLLAFSGHKGLMGPLGTGGLYVGERVHLIPYVTGGTGSYSKSLIQPSDLPDMLHAGTLNTPAIAALGTAADYVRKYGTARILAHERELANLLINKLKGIENLTLLGTEDITKRNGTVAFVLDNIESQNAALELSEKYDIAVRGGWHCAYMAHETLGSQEHGAVRIGIGFYNTARDIDLLVNAIKKISAKK